jgi:CRP-like cAMP-binding protein
LITSASAGLLKLSIAYPNRKEVILTILEPGNWFGAGPVLQRRPRGHSATALEDCEIFGVSAAKFDELMNRTGFARAVARQMAERLRLAYASMSATALLSLRERILRLLTVLSRGGLTLSEHGRSTICTSQESLAMMLGISRPTLNKELHALAELGPRHGSIRAN